MYVDSEMLEGEFRQYFDSERSILAYVKQAFDLFLTDPIVTGAGTLRWPDKGFETSLNVTQRTVRSTYGYNPLTCMLLALNRLDDNRLKTAVVYDIWMKETFVESNVKSFRVAVLEKLFVEGLPAIHVESFTAVEATNVTRIKIALVGTARCARDIAPSYRWLKNTYESWLGTIRLYSDDENRLVTACQRAAGIKRRTRRCNETITVKCEPRKWLFEWSDCALVTFGGVTYYERRDERIKWISILIWEFICNKLHKDHIPLCILLSLDRR